MDLTKANLPKANDALAHLSSVVKDNAGSFKDQAVSTAVKARAQAPHLCTTDHQKELTMKKTFIKLAFIVGLGAGYVLGAKAGRARYESIKEKAHDVVEHPKTQEVKDKAVEKASELKDEVVAKVQEVKTKDASSTSVAKPASSGPKTL